MNFAAFENLFDVKEFKEFMRVHNNQRYSCAIEGPDPVKLLDWTVDATNEAFPDLRHLKIMNTDHKMSENDLINMCSPMKIAKGGYYQIPDSKNGNK